MELQTLRVVARGTSMVPDFERMEAGIRAFVGRKYIEVTPGRFGFDRTGEVAEVPNRAEYVKALCDGDLWPADKATADACGLTVDAATGKNVPAVVYDPTYGGLVRPTVPRPDAPKNALQQLAPTETPATAAIDSAAGDGDPDVLPLGPGDESLKDTAPANHLTTSSSSTPKEG